MNKFTTHKLTNGLEYILVPDDSFNNICFVFYVRFGSKYEIERVNGIAHFVEHMVFKGTKKYPTPIKISKTLDIFGGNFNAYTDKHYTAYHIKIPYSKKAVETVLDVISDMLFHSLIKQPDLQVERKVILEEINKEFDDEDDYSARILCEQMFKNTRLEKSVIGTKQTVSNISRGDMLYYLVKYYQHSNIKLAVGGKIPKNIHTLIKKYLVKKSTHHIPKIALNQNNKEHSQIILNQYHRYSESNEYRIRSIRRSNMSQVLMSIAFPCEGIFDKNQYEIDIMDNIFVSNMSSRLFIELREKNGLVYEVSSDYVLYEELGYYSIITRFVPKDLEKVLRIIIKNIKKIKNKLVSPSELSDAIESQVNSEKMASDNILDLTEFYGEQFLLKPRITTLDENIDKYKKVKADKIQNVCRDLFNFSLMNIVTIGNLNQNMLKKVISKIRL